MSTLLQFLALVAINTVVWYCGYRRGKTIKERELQDMEIPELTPKEEEELRKLNMLEKLFGDDYDGGFTGDLSKSSKTETEKDTQI